MLPNIGSRYERMRCSRIKQHNCRSVVDEKHTNDNIRSFLRFFHDNMVDSPTSIVLLGSNRNRVGSMGRGKCSCNWPVDAWVRVGASVSKMTIHSTSKTPPFSRQQVRSNLGSLSILIPSSRDLGIVGALNHLTLRDRKSLSNDLWPRLELWLSRSEHRSRCRCSNTWSRATA
jgi:hypothetical protein